MSGAAAKPISFDRPTTDAPADALDLAWGIDAIAAYIGRTRRQTYEALAKGQLPARQVNRRWVASRRKLRELFEGVGVDG